MWMMDDWAWNPSTPQICSSVHPGNQEAKRDEGGSWGGGFNLGCTRAAGTSTSASDLPHPVGSDFPPFGCKGLPEAELRRRGVHILNPEPKTQSLQAGITNCKEFWLQLARVVSQPSRLQHLPLCRAPDPAIYRHSCQNRVSVPRFLIM